MPRGLFRHILALSRRIDLRRVTSVSLNNYSDPPEIGYPSEQ
jgi:hypothetical protein